VSASSGFEDRLRAPEPPSAGPEAAGDVREKLARNRSEPERKKFCARFTSQCRADISSRADRQSTVIAPWTFAILRQQGTHARSDSVASAMAWGRSTRSPQGLRTGRRTVAGPDAQGCL